MATAEAVAKALAILRADRPGLGLEESIDAHWIRWFSRSCFLDADIRTAVNWYISENPARIWPTVALIEAIIRKVERHKKEALAAAETCEECKDGLIYKTFERPYRYSALVPCDCSVGRAKTAALQAGADRHRYLIGAELEESGQ